MKSQNNTKYRLFRRSTGIYFLQDNQTGRQQSLKTREKGVAQALLHASNEAHRQPFLNLQLARTYLNAADPKMVTRTWQEVMEELTRNKRGSTQERYARAIEDRAFDPIRQLPVIESRSEHFLKVLANQRSSTNLYLRRIHNFALGMDWLLKPIIPRLEWPKVVYGEKRAITGRAAPGCKAPFMGTGGRYRRGQPSWLPRWLRFTGRRSAIRRMPIVSYAENHADP